MTELGPERTATLDAPPCVRPEGARALLPAAQAAPSFERRALRLLGPAARGALKLLALMAILTACRSTLADQYQVPTASMWPTIAPGDHIFVDKLAYGVRAPFTGRTLLERSAPRAGDVVLFADPRGGALLLVKRVVAVAGQTVSVRDGILYVDGVPQPLEHLADGTTVEHLGGCTHAAGERDGAVFGPAEVPPGHLFVMGDNRAASLDSRAMGAVPLGLVRGRVVGVMYHVDDAGLDMSRLMRGID